MNQSFEHTTVEQNRRGMEKSGPLRHNLSETLQVGGGRGLATEEGGQVAGESGILGIGKAQLSQSAPRPNRRPGVSLHHREEALQHCGFNLRPAQLAADGATDQPGSPPRHHHR